MKLYLAVTADRFELPVAVSESVPELARMVGRAQCTIYTAIRKNKLRGNQPVETPKANGLRFYEVSYWENDDLKRALC